MKFIIAIPIIFFFYSVNAEEIRSIVQVDNHSITNVDLLREIRINEILKKKQLNNSEKNILLKNLIEEKIKQIETNKNKIVVNKSDVNKRVAQVLKKFELNESNNEQIKKYIFDKIEINMKWNKLIMILFSKKLQINMNEIEEKVKNKKIDVAKKEELIQIEKTKKINIISNTFLNEVKRKYLIKNIR